MTDIVPFLNEINNRFNIDIDELKRIWELCNIKRVSDIEYKKMKKPELVKLCNEAGVNSKGKKSDLIARLLSCKNKTTVIDIAIKNSERSIIKIRKNSFNNYTHESSSLVFDPNESIVIGKQADDGTVLELTLDDINTCNKLKFEYNLPDDLNTSVDDLEEEIVIEDNIDTEHVEIDSSDDDFADYTDEKLDN